MTAIERICPDARRLLLIPENHTRNQFYLQNVARLRTILRQAGLEVRIGTLIPEINAPTELAVPDAAPLAPRTARAPRRPARPRGLRSLHDPAQQRSVCRRARRSSRASTSSGCCRRCTPAGRCGANRTTSALRPGRERVREAARDRPLAHQPVSRALRRGELQGEERRRLPRRERRGAAAADPGQVPRVRDQGAAVRRRQGRRRHLRHGHHDGEEPGRRARPQPRRSARRWRWSRKASRCTR